MQLTVDTIYAVTRVNLDETAANNIWIPAVKQEIETRCNRTFMGDDAAHKPQSGTISWVRYEIPAGVVDGVNTQFTLAQTPQPNKVEIYVDGQLIMPGENADYTMDGNTITFSSAPESGSEHPIWANYLPLGAEDDEEESQEAEYPYDLGVAACWRTVLLANEDPLNDVATTSDTNIKSESTGSLKVEYFENVTQRKEEIITKWDKVIKRYRIPAICDSSQTPSPFTGSSW